MKEKFDIENTFKDTFNGFNAKPANSVWKNIEQSLNTEFSEIVYKNQFNNYSHKISETLWNKIAAKLWWDKFLHFSFASFNAYYTATLLIAFISTILFINKNIILKNTENKFIDKNIVFVKHNKNINKHQNINYTYPENNDSLKTNKKKKEKRQVNQKLTKNDNIQKQADEYYNASIISEIEASKVKIVHHYKTDTILLRDTVVLVDTVYKDVVKDPLKYIKSPWSLDLYYNPMFANSSISGQDDIIKILDENTTPAYSWNFGVNVNYKYKNFNFASGISLTQYRENIDYYEENIDINKTEETRWQVVGEYTYINKYTDWVITTVQYIPVIDTFNFSYVVNQYEENSVLIIDTTWFYEIDTIMQTHYDSIEIIRYDTITALKFDSVDVVIVDTVKTRSFYEFVNRYTYMEVPLIINYEIKQNKFSYVFGGGLLTGVFLNAQGKGITVKDEITNLKELPFMRFNFSASVNAGIHYHFNPKMSLLIEGVYRKNLTSIYKNSYFLTKRFNGLGLKIGIRYKF